MTSFVDNAILKENNILEEDISYELFDSELHGNGLRSTKYIQSGTIIFSEKPLHHLQTLPNKQGIP